MRWIEIVAAAASALVLAIAPMAQAANESASRIRLPFHVKNGLILIDGRVDQTSGVFMLDTGETYFRFLLNRTYVPLGPGTDLYKMHAESGQASMTQKHDGVHTIALADALTTTAQSGDPGAPQQAVSDDFQRMMQNFDPHLLGVIGYAFLKQYDFTIDYQAGNVALYAIGAAPKPRGGITIKFIPSSPVVPFPLNFEGIEIPTVMDTGGWEEMKAPQAVWDRLAAGGHVTDASAEGANCVTLPGAQYGSAPAFNIPHANRVVVRDGEPTKLTLGYPFLRRYLNIYSSREGTVSLVPIANVPPLPPDSCE